MHKILGNSDTKNGLKIGQLFTLLPNFIQTSDTKTYNISRDRKWISEGLHTLWPVSMAKKGILWEHSSYQCESYECASLRIRSFRITCSQISASIPSETDYPGLSQTQRIITGSPLGHCSLHAPRMEIHCWARCQRWLGGNTGYCLTPTYTKTTHKQFSYSLVATVFVSLHFYNSHISLLVSLPAISGIPLCLRHVLSQLSWHPLPLSDAPIVHITPISPFHPTLLFHISCISSTSPPSGVFISDTVETLDTNAAQTHLPCSWQKYFPLLLVGNWDVQKIGVKKNEIGMETSQGQRDTGRNLRPPLVPKPLLEHNTKVPFPSKINLPALWILKKGWKRWLNKSWIPN